MPRTAKPAAIVRALVWIALILTAGCGHATPASERTTVRFLAVLSGGPTLSLTDELARHYRTALPQLDIRFVHNGGSVAGIEAIQRGEADVGYVNADIVYLGFVGKLEGQKAPFRDLRGIAVLRTSVLHVVARPGLPMTRLADLPGHSVAIGPAGSGTNQLARIILADAGVSLAQLRFESLPFDEAAAKLHRGDLDAMFVASTYPAKSVEEATAAGGHLVPLAAGDTRGLRGTYPFLQIAKVPAGTYPGQTSAVPTLGVDTLLVCRRGLPEQLVYDLTRELFEALPTLTSLFDSMPPMTAERTPSTMIPLHEGAARYYRERELFR